MAPPLRAALRRQSPAAGFTLIEILVVVLIIGILATVFSLSIGNRSVDERVQSEAQRLQQILRLAIEEAEIKGVQVGFRYTEEGYEFLVINEEGHWAAIEGTGPLRPRELGVPFDIQLRVEGRVVAPAVSREFAPDADDGGDGPPIVPQFLLLSSGEVMPFMLWIGVERQQESGFIVQGDLTGNIQLQRWDRETWNEQTKPAARKL